MNLENMENSPRKAAENNRCGFHRVKLVSQKFTVLGVSGRKITRNDARYLDGMLENKTSRNATAIAPGSPLIPCRGQLGFFSLPEDVNQQVDAALKARNPSHEG